MDLTISLNTTDYSVKRGTTVTAAEMAAINTFMVKLAT